MTPDHVARLAALGQALAALEQVVAQTQRQLEDARAELARLAASAPRRTPR